MNSEMIGWRSLPENLLVESYDPHEKAEGGLQAVELGLQADTIEWVVLWPA